MTTHRAEAEAVYQLVQKQAEDEGLWFIAETAPEAYLQAALRELHAAVERAAELGAMEAMTPQREAEREIERPLSPEADLTVRQAIRAAMLWAYRDAAEQCRAVHRHRGLPAGEARAVRDVPSSQVRGSQVTTPTRDELLAAALELRELAYGIIGPTINARIAALLERCAEMVKDGYVLVPAQELLAVRDACSEGDSSEAFHRLYWSVEWADPYKPWMEWERAAAQGEGK